ncbi:MAG: hypothetical protein GXP27_00465, partial [Planctomycetes bacterium]|nr:hypothetical protein [Planctomycetota bacterium]
GGDQLVPLPPPSAEGVILLDSDGPYQVADISSAGPLVLRGADGRHPLVVITDEPLRIWAQQVVLENIRFVTQEATPTRIAHGLSATTNRATHPAKAGRRPAALLLVRSQSFAVEHCVFQTHRVIPVATTVPASADKSITTLPRNGAGGSHAPGDNQNSDTGRSHADRPEGPSSTDEELPVAWGAAGPPVAVAWKPLDAAEPMGRIVSFHNTVFVGQSTAVYLGGAAQHVSAGNCLKLGAGQMFDAAAEALAGRTLRLALEHCTLRDAGALLRLIWPTVADRKWPSPESASFQITINATDCVLDIDAAQAALLEWLGPPTEAAWLASVEVRGGGSLIRPELALAAAVELPSGRRRDLDGSRLAVEGLMAPTYRFAGPIRLDWTQSTLSFCDAPRTAALPPGIDASQLPAWPAGVARSGQPVREK